MDTIFMPIQKVDFKIDLDGWSVFPNPVQNELFINLKSFAGKQARIQLINNFGQVVLDQNLGELSGETERLDMKNVENGLYFIHIKVEGQKAFNQKVIVERLY